MADFFYSDEDKKIVCEDLLDKKARDWAKSFLEPKQLDENGRKDRQTSSGKPHQSDGKAKRKNPKLSSAQLRKFYHEVKELEERVKRAAHPSAEFARVKPLISMLKSKAAYACPDKGGDRKIPTEFKTYIEEMVKNVSDHKDLFAFALCFEAVVGYFYGMGGGAIG